MTSKLTRGLASCATVTALALGTAGPALAHGASATTASRPDPLR